MPRKFLLFETAAAGGEPGSDVAIDVDNGFPSTEYLRDSTAQAVGIANVWTVAFWIKPTTIVNGRVPLSIRNVSSANSAIEFFTFTTSNGGIQLLMRNSAGTLFKNYTWNNSGSGVITNGSWTHVVITWDGTDLLGYFDGTLDASPSTPTDNAGTMADDNRPIGYGATSSGTSGVIARLGHFCIWDVALSSAEVTEIFGTKFTNDLRVNTGDYVSSANLQHYFRVGNDSADIGKDEGVATPLYDLMDNQLNITAGDDIVVDAPT